VEDEGMLSLSKWRLLLGLLPQYPGEFYDRVAAQIDYNLELLIVDRLFGRPPQYNTVSWERAMQDMEAYFGHVVDILSESALSEIEESVRRRYANIRYEIVGNPEWGGDPILARCCYLACRLLKPDAVVECGVSYGVTSAFILRALKENGRGRLHSLDLPNLRRNFDKFWGIAVPEELKSRWKLQRGSSKRVLSEILRETGTVDIFVHDASPTYRGKQRDFETVWPHLRIGGMIIAHQVHLNRAWDELQRRKPTFCCVVQDTSTQPLFGKDVKHVMCGIATK
jgi:predicted O-methyltransferase YrrM